jgi:hypothetical protein
MVDITGHEAALCNIKIARFTRLALTLTAMLYVLVATIYMYMHIVYKHTSTHILCTKCYLIYVFEIMSRYSFESTADLGCYLVT